MAVDQYIAPYRPGATRQACLIWMPGTGVRVWKNADGWRKWEILGGAGGARSTLEFPLGSAPGLVQRPQASPDWVRNHVRPSKPAQGPQKAVLLSLRPPTRAKPPFAAHSAAERRSPLLGNACQPREKSQGPSAAPRGASRRGEVIMRGWGPRAPSPSWTPSPSPRTDLGWSDLRTAERAPRLRLGGLRADGG